MARHGLAAAQLSTELELVGSDLLVALAVVAVEPDVNQVARVVRILRELDLTRAFCRAEEPQPDIALDRQAVVLQRDFLGGLVDVNSATSPEQGHVVVLSGEVGVVYEVAVVARRHLRPNRVLNREPVLNRLENGRLRKPVWRVYLERVGVLAWLQVLAVGELYDDLLDGEDLLDFLVVVFQGNPALRRQMTSLDAFELNNQVGGFEHLSNLDIDRAGDRAACDVAKHVVVEVYVDRTVGVQVKWLVPEHTSVRPSPPAAGELRGSLQVSDIACTVCRFDHFVAPLSSPMIFLIKIDAV